MTKSAGSELHRRAAKFKETKETLEAKAIRDPKEAMESKETGFWVKFLARFRFFGSHKPTRVLHDQIQLSLAGLKITMEREINPDIPHEVSVYVPRAEIRKNCPRGTACPPEGCPDCTVEILLNSISIVHSPRHPLAGEAQKPPEIPQKN